MLAWVRTSIAVTALGFLAERFDLFLTGGIYSALVVFVALGQDPDLAPVQNVLRPKITRDQWLAIHTAHYCVPVAKAGRDSD
jgi:hypothetical protein